MALRERSSPAESPAPGRGAGLAARGLVALGLAAHGVAAAAWWWGSPHGFPALHPQWWANEVAPWIGLAFALGGCGLLARGRKAAAHAVLVMFGAAWLGGAAGGLALFPASGPRWALLPSLAAGLVLAAVAAAGRPSPAASRRWLASAPLAALTGAALALTQRAAPPDTRPLGHAPSVAVPEGAAGEAEGPLDAARGTVHLHAGGLEVWVEPLLTFRSCSPDGCWTIFSPRDAFTLPPRRLVGWTTPAPGEAAARYACGGRADDVLHVRRDGGALAVDAATTLHAPVLSHLGAYTTLLARAPAGAPPFTIAFSPCPERAIEVLPADYPVGRPLRVAYLDGDGVFRVAEATSGEKGPFHELAAGPLARGAPLTATLRAGEAALRVTWLDFSAQAGTALSPTAGWGLPVNALELRLEAPGLMSLGCALAATSVGRGWHSVGHAAGTYRNRLRLEGAAP